MTKYEIQEAINEIGMNIHNMSFVIVAGFSKNISNHYLSWRELMEDMVEEM